MEAFRARLLKALWGSPTAAPYGFLLLLFGLRNSELVQRALQVAQEGVPLGRGNPEISMQHLHRASAIVLRPTARPADQFGDEVLEAGGRDPMMRFIDPWVRIQTWVVHDPVDELIHNRGYAIDTTQPFV